LSLEWETWNSRENRAVIWSETMKRSPQSDTLKVNENTETESESASY
jgi:hypothetical protein